MLSQDASSADVCQGKPQEPILEARLFVGDFYVNRNVTMSSSPFLPRLKCG